MFDIISLVYSNVIPLAVDKRPSLRCTNEALFKDIPPQIDKQVPSLK